MKNASLRRRFFERLGSYEQVFGLLDHLPGLSFFVKDRQGRFVALNRRGCEYCGIGSEDDAIGKTDYDFFPKQRADEYRADDLAVMQSGEAILNRMESAPEAEGSPRLVVTTKIPLRDSRGRVIGVAGLSRQVEQLREQPRTATAFADVIEYLHAHYEQHLTTKELAKKAGLSVSQFDRRFRAAFGSSPHQYIMRVRVENAARLLIETDQTVSEIAHTCGFYDHAHFSRSFRRIMNATPTQYRSR
ncbi:HTH-type transcriptional activator Btr [Planctomycetes bacterium CA13]|uniref:HTH-type transcriptional activator Btr n=1 Tax=Novipirellula herctigrandis TaxID=2527986 RepID=A0A5C5Z432_9BACT|nr:HTH-type transcriptional activator Btr [Planctomycetes bacterium CA13]